MKRAATRSLGAVIADYVQESNLSEGLLQTRVLAAWDAMTLGQIVLRDYTSQHSFRDGVLTCRIRSSVVRSHLQMQETLLCSRLNQALGCECVERIKFA